MLAVSGVSTEPPEEAVAVVVAVVEAAGVADYWTVKSCKTALKAASSTSFATGLITSLIPVPDYNWVNTPDTEV